jgi:deoxyribonuclease V
MILSQRRIDRWRKDQKRIAKDVIWSDAFDYPPKLIAGLDVAYKENRAFGAAAVLDYETLKAVEVQTARATVKVPYVASFFAFREVKPLVRVIKKLKKKADIYLVNAHGVAHPMRCGCASHLGVLLGIPTIGVASTPICGTVSESGNMGIRYLSDQGEIIGAVLHTKPTARPICVSTGHRVGLDSAIEIITRTVRENRMPEPLRIAHIHATMAKRNM